MSGFSRRRASTRYARHAQTIERGSARHDFLDRLPFFRELRDTQRLSLMRHARLGRFRCGQCIIAEGTVATSIMVLLHGRVNVVRNVVAEGVGDEVDDEIGGWASDVGITNDLQYSEWFGELTSDDVFGEGALCPGTSYRDASIVATSNCTVLTFQVEAFDFDEEVMSRLRNAAMSSARIHRAHSPTHRLCERLKAADPQTLHSIILQSPRMVIGLPPPSHPPNAHDSGQVLTDLQREPGVVLDDLTVPTNTDEASKQFFRRVSAAVVDLRRNGGAENAHEASSEASMMATALLSLCSRTTAGGDAYTAVSTLFPTQVVCSRQPTSHEVDALATSFRFHPNCIECRSVNLFGLIRSDVETEHRRWIDIVASVYTYIVVLDGKMKVFRLLECANTISNQWLT